MAERKVTFLVGANIKQFTTAMGKVERRFKSFGRKTQSIGRTLSTGITAPLAAVAGLALKSSANFETLRTSMDVLNGSVEEGARNFERLKKFSAQTPFQLGDLAKAQNMLQGFGLSADDAFNSLQMIGDIAAVSGGDINGIGIAFGQAAAEGRLMSRDIRQLINQGVPAIKLLADTMGVAESEIFDLASQGEISFDILQQAFRDATSEGGMFADGMRKQSRTLAGLWSTLTDNVSIALGELGQSISETFNIPELMQRTINKIQEVVSWFQQLSKESKANLLKIVAAIGLIPPALVGIGATISGLGIAIGALTSPITLVIGAVGGLAAAFLYVRDNWNAIVERISDIDWWRNAIISMIQFFMKYNPFRYMMDAFNEVLIFLGREPFGNIFTAAAEDLELLKGETKEYATEFGSMKDAILNGVRDLSGIDFANLFTFGGGSGVSMGAPGKPSTAPSAPVAETIGMSAVDSYMQQVFQDNQAYADAFNHRLEAVKDTTGVLNDVANTFTNAFSDGMSRLIVQGQKLSSTLKDIGRTLLSSGIKTLIGGFLTGGLGGAGFFGAGGGLFGRIFGVNDAIISPTGDIITTDPNDYLIATKTPESLGGGGMTPGMLVAALSRVTWRMDVDKGQIYAAGVQGGTTFNR